MGTFLIFYQNKNLFESEPMFFLLFFYNKYAPVFIKGQPRHL